MNMKIAVFIALFLLLGAFYIISEDSIALNSWENAHIFFEKYLFWIVTLVDNSRSVVGSVVKMEWIPDTAA
jgi:hypothetical protein